MAMTADDYRRALEALLPPGPAWRVVPGGTLDNLLQALADELARLDARGDRLTDEADPRTTVELLSEWESVVSLPDECTPTEQSLSERRETLVQRLTEQADLSESGWIARAARLGHDITLREPQPSRAGVMQAGDELAPPEAVFELEVTAPVELTHPFETGAAQAGDPLGSWNTQRLECELARMRQAHTHLNFKYETS